MTSSNIVVALFRDRSHLESAISDLRNAGFGGDDIGVGVMGGLVGLGLHEDDAKHFERGLRNGGAIVTVDAGGRRMEVLDLLRKHEADLGPPAMAPAGAGNVSRI